MTTPKRWDNLIGRTAVGSDSDKVGRIGQVYVDDVTGQPEWVTVSTGLFGTRESFAPLYNSEVRDDQLVLAVPKQLVKDAPNVEDDGHLADDETAALYQHYADYLNPAYAQAGGGRLPGGTGYESGDISYEAGRTGHESGGTGYEAGGTGAGLGAQGYDTSGPTTDNAMTRSEERLHVGTENQRVSRARLRKYVVTEPVTTTVPVSHEEVRLEREPITDANRDAALAGPEITEEEHEVALHAERPVVTKEAVPVERVRLGTETVTEEQQISEQVRKEQIDSPDIDTSEPGPGR